MPSIKDLKKRIGSVKNTQQTTRAMKMVSAAKLRRAQEAIQNQRPYAKRVGQLIHLLASRVSGNIENPCMPREASEGAKKKLLFVVVSSDRGLCGGFNATVIKTTQRWIAAHAGEYESIHLGFVGKKAYDFFKNRKVNLGPYWSEAGGKVTFSKARKLADALVELYASEQFDEVKIVYNEFKNAVTQKIVVENFLPLDPTATSTVEGETMPAEQHQGDTDLVFIVKPSPEAVLNELMSKNFGIQAFRILLESQASEHGARMSAMENATKNAGEMIRKLSLQYNKQRQAGITKELLEIIAGSESQKASA